MSGHRNFNELRAKMSPERRARNEAEAENMQKVYLLSQIRQQVGLTQAEVANRLGVSQPTYAECERASNMRLGTLEKIIAALGGKFSFHVEFDNFNCELQMPRQMAMA